jgi:lipoic acid synthetase
MNTVKYINLGLISYTECLDLQMEIVNLRHEGVISDIVLLLEHNPVITMGRSGGEDALLVTHERLSEAGIELYDTDRGGNITYHGPGQLVGYPIFDLRDYGKDAHLFLRNLEQVVIETIGEFGVTGEAVPGLTGVWVNGDKISSIGVAARKWISYHGFALNVDPNLKHWALLHPCGLIGKHVTALKMLTDVCPSMDDVKSAAVQSFAKVFDIKLEQMSLSELKQLIDSHRSQAIV